MIRFVLREETTILLNTSDVFTSHPYVLVLPRPRSAKRGAEQGSRGASKYLPGTFDKMRVYLKEIPVL